MSNHDEGQAPSDEGLEAGAVATEETAAEGEEKPRKIDLALEISDVGPCKKHLKVTIPAEEIEHQFKDSLQSMRKDAAMPGFRPGRAPVALINKRYKKEVAGQVKSALLGAALAQIDEEHKLHPISQPNLDLEAIEIPDAGPMTIEMDVEVQPEFALPNYKGLKVKRPIREVADSDVDAAMQNFLLRRAQEVPKFEGGAEKGDLVTAALTLEKDGVQIVQAKEVSFRLMERLQMQEGAIEDILPALEGAKPGDIREATAQIGSSAADPAIRGQALRAIFQVLDLKSYRIPELDDTLLASVGFDTVDELRDALRRMIERQFDYQKRRYMRAGVVEQLVDQTPFELPADLVARQEKSTLRNMVLEMRRGGLSEDQIRAREASIRSNAHETTLRNLKEFFILAKIAEEEKIEVTEDDFENEIVQIAMESDESPRRVRSRIEKEGLRDGLETQILERKVIERILENAQYEDFTLADEKPVETLDEAVTPEPTPTEEAAEAAAEGEAESAPEPTGESA